MLAAKKNGGFDPNPFLATIGEGRKILSVPKKQMIFVQGDGADAVFYVQKAKVRLTVVSKIGKEATILHNCSNVCVPGALPHVAAVQDFFLVAKMERTSSCLRFSEFSGAVDPSGKNKLQSHSDQD